MQKAFAVIALFIFLINLSCKKSPTESEDKDHGRRDYVWTVDTIYGEKGYLLLLNIWGDSPDNIWICGSNGSNSLRVWNYNGERWKGLGVQNLYPEGIFGFGKKNIWAASGNQIWHYDGTKWKVNYEAVIDSFKVISFQKFYGWNENNIWVVGLTDNLDNNQHGIIYHYDGTSWKQKYISKESNIYYWDIYPTESTDKFLIEGLTRTYNPNIDSSTVFVYEGNEVRKFYQSGFGGANTSRIKSVGKQLYLSQGSSIYRYNNDTLTYFLSSSVIDGGLLFGGRNENDIFVWQPDGLAHYNGIDTKYIFNKIPNIRFVYGIIIFDKEIFCFAEDTQNRNYYFIKGELKD